MRKLAYSPNDRILTVEEEARQCFDLHPNLRPQVRAMDARFFTAERRRFLLAVGLLCGAVVLACGPAPHPRTPLVSCSAGVSSEATTEATATTWRGWITDSACRGDGAHAQHAPCARKCFAAGQTFVLYDLGSRTILTLDRQDLARRFLGHEVTVTGKLRGGRIAVREMRR